jgi:uncharacterized Zn-binding protein involved in type VI secretion
MPAAARLRDPTSHPGLVAQGSPNVLIEGMPAARAGDKHTCLLPPTAGPHPPSPMAKGSGTVHINDKPAVRQLDTAGCGAQVLAGAPTVLIGD